MLRCLTWAGCSFASFLLFSLLSFFNFETPHLYLFYQETLKILLFDAKPIFKYTYKTLNYYNYLFFIVQIQDIWRHK